MLGGDGISKEFADRFKDFKELSLMEREKEVLESLHKKSRADGFEHGAIIIAGDSNIYKFSSKLKDKVRIPEREIHLINSAIEKSVHLFHSHTNITPHSTVDFEWLLNKNIDRVSVISYNKDVFSVWVGDGWIPTKNEFEDITLSIKGKTRIDVLNLPEFDDLTIGERNNAAIREQAFQIARHFKWTMEGGSLL